MKLVDGNTEYSTVNSNFIMRAQTTNSFWLGGLGTKLVIIYNLLSFNGSSVLSTELLPYVIFLFSILFMSFNLAIGWHLDEIAKLRTYMLVMFEKDNYIGWEDGFYKLKRHNMLTKDRRVVLITYTVPFAIIYIYLLLLALHIQNVQVSFSIILSLVLSLFAYFSSLYYVCYSYSKNNFVKYYTVWSDYKSYVEYKTSSKTLSPHTSV